MSFSKSISQFQKRPDAAKGKQPAEILCSRVTDHNGRLSGLRGQGRVQDSDMADICGYERISIFFYINFSFVTNNSLS